MSERDQDLRAQGVPVFRKGHVPGTAGCTFARRAPWYIGI